MFESVIATKSLATCAMTALMTLTSAFPAAAGTAPDDAPAPSAAPAPTHELHLTRARVVGQRVRVTVEGSQEVSSTPRINGGQSRAQTTSLYIKLSAEARVLAVDERKQPVRVEHRVEECDARLDGRTLRVARPGDVIVAERKDGETVFTVNGRPVESPAADGLRIVLRLDDAGATHDDFAATSTPRAIGEKWSVDVDAVLRDLRSQSSRPVEASDVTGTVSFAGLVERDGHSCQFVETDFMVRDWLSTVTPPFEIESATFAVLLRGLYPEDPSLPVLAESQRLEIDAVLAAADGSLACELSVVQRIEREVTPLDDADAVAEVTSDGAP